MIYWRMTRHAINDQFIICLTVTGSILFRFVTKHQQYTHSHSPMYYWLQYNNILII